MKKTFLTTLSLCAFTLSATSANAEGINVKEKSRRAEIEKNVNCKNVLDACSKVGFVAGEFSEGKGLWKDCFKPTLKGKTVTLSGKKIEVAANAQDVAACKSVVTELVADGK